jgi:tight adherence protein C
MFAQSFDLTHVIPFAVFGAFSVIIWVMADFVWKKRNQAEDRLARLDSSGMPGEEEGSLTKVSSAVSGLVEKASPQLAKPLQATNEKEANNQKMRLSHAGFRSDVAVPAFLSLKVICLVIGFLLGGGVVMATMGMTKAALMRIVLVVGCSFFLPDIILFFLTRRRKQAIFLSLPDAIDLMVVCVEAGLGLDQAMRKVASELGKAYPIIAREFETANMQLQMGLNRVEVLRDLGHRNGEDELRGLASVLIHASKFGTGVGTALRAHSDAMRTRRRQMAEEKAAKSAVKLIFPLVLFIFPGIFVVLVGPAAISIIRNLLPALSSG